MKHFTLPELCHSATARKYKINNECSLAHIHKLTLLVNNVLDPLREAWGSFFEFSKYRSRKKRGSRENVMSLLKQTQRMTQHLPVMDMKPAKGMSWQEFYNYLDRALLMNPSIRLK
ncbi:hypothetical protein LJC72_12590 [Bacteroides sp. OttesenSCG-928-D19]|nr:hypothetical protein [Bacteroides sp. OttesenSCG-928-D19]